jgi:hypothetical protein
VNAVRAGLVQDGFSWPFVIAVVLAAILGWLSIYLFHAREQRETEAVEPEHVALVCLLSVCQRPATHTFYGSEGHVYSCNHHAGEVAKFCGRPVFDQDAGVA